MHAYTQTGRSGAAQCSLIAMKAGLLGLIRLIWKQIWTNYNLFHTTWKLTEFTWIGPASHAPSCFNVFQTFHRSTAPLPIHNAIPKLVAKFFLRLSRNWPDLVPGTPLSLRHPAQTLRVSVDTCIPLVFWILQDSNIYIPIPRPRDPYKRVQPAILMNLLQQLRAQMSNERFNGAGNNLYFIEIGVGTESMLFGFLNICNALRCMFDS